MYIELQNNEHTNEIIETLKTFGVEVRTNAYSVITFVRIDTSLESKLSAIISYGKLRVFVKKDVNACMEIDMKNVNVIYDL